MVTAITILATLLDSYLYRLGGIGRRNKHDKPLYSWLPDALFNTKARDVGCAAVTVGSMALCTAHPFPWYAYVIAFGATFGALTTYWDSVPFNKGEDNFYMHGFMIGLAMLPFAIIANTMMFWLMFGARCLAMALLMGVVCAISGNDDVEEHTRGGVIGATLWMIMVV